MSQSTRDDRKDTTPTTGRAVWQVTRRNVLAAAGAALTTKALAQPRGDLSPANHSSQSQDTDLEIARYDTAGRQGAIVAGRGEPLILVHGLGSTADVWRPILPILARNFRVMAVTLPGHVGGPTQPSGKRLQDHIDFVLDIVDNDAEFEAAHVAGFSIGGSIALEVARATHIRSACAIGPGNHTYAASLKTANSQIITRLNNARAQRDTLSEAAQDPDVRRAELGLIAQHGENVSPEAFEAFVSNQLDCAVMEDLLADTSAFDALPRLPDCSISIVWGDQDLLFPNDPNASIVRTNVPGASYIELPDSGHVTLIDQPLLTVNAIRFTAGSRENPSRM